MATKPPKTDTSEARPLARMMNVARSWFRRAKTDLDANRASDLIDFDGGTTIASMLGWANRPARTRTAIYDQWAYMGGDPIISTAIGLLVTAALGGHETTGDTVFIELAPGVKEGSEQARMVQEIRDALSRQFNLVAAPVAFNACVFGDAYARLYTKRGVGIEAISADELVHPALVQAYEQGGRTSGYVVYTGARQHERLSITQMARMRMPRMMYVPQPSIVEKSMRQNLLTDDIEELPHLPAMVGGSLLYPVEDPFFKLQSALAGLLGQRILDSIDEQIFGVNLDSATTDQQARLLRSIRRMFESSKLRAEEAVKSGKPSLERIRHILPVTSDKQLTSVQQFPARAASGAQGYSIEDVMLYARLLSGAIGVDLSMIGFADQMAGGLGEGGWFRQSAQVAERAKMIRTALDEFFEHNLDVHTYHRYGQVFKRGERPWQINFYGSIAALETERQKTKADAMNSGVVLLQAMDQLKTAGADESQAQAFLTTQMMVDEEDAKVFAKIVTQPARVPGGEMGGGFGGDGFGPGGLPQVPTEDDDDPPKPRNLQ